MFLMVLTPINDKEGEKKYLTRDDQSSRRRQKDQTRFSSPFIDQNLSLELPGFNEPQSPLTDALRGQLPSLAKVLNGIILECRDVLKKS